MVFQAADSMDRLVNRWSLSLEVGFIPDLTWGEQSVWNGNVTAISWQRWAKGDMARIPSWPFHDNMGFSTYCTSFLLQTTLDLDMESIAITPLSWLDTSWSSINWWLPMTSKVMPIQRIHPRHFWIRVVSGGHLIFPKDLMCESTECLDRCSQHRQQALMSPQWNCF